MVLKDEELAFLLKQTKLPPKQLGWLLEEERDFDLILEAVSKQSISKNKIREKLNKFSHPFSVKYLLYRFNKDENVDIGILSYLADTIIEYIPIIQKNQSFRKINGKLTEDNGKYFLTASGIYRDELANQKLDYKNFVNFAAKCFINIGRQNFARNIKNYSDLIYNFSLQKNL